MPAITLDRRNSQAIRRNRSRSDACFLQFRQNLGTVRLQRVDAQVERRARGKSLRLSHPTLAIGAAQQGHAPVRTVSRHRFGHGRLPLLADRRTFGIIERRRRETVAIELGIEPLRRQAIQQESAEAQRARRFGTEEPAR